MNGSEVLTVAEVAKVMRCSKSVVYGEIRAGRLDVIRIGERVWRVSRVALERWIETAAKS